MDIHTAWRCPPAKCPFERWNRCSCTPIRRCTILETTEVHCHPSRVYVCAIQSNLTRKTQRAVCGGRGATSDASRVSLRGAAPAKAKARNPITHCCCDIASKHLVCEVFFRRLKGHQPTRLYCITCYLGHMTLHGAPATQLATRSAMFGHKMHQRRHSAALQDAGSAAGHSTSSTFRSLH